MANQQKKKKTVILIISLLIITSLLAGGGFLIIKNNSKTKNAANNQPTRKEKEPTPPKDNPQPKPDKSPQPNPVPKPNNPPQQNNNEYPAINAGGREPEYKINPPLPISSVGTNPIFGELLKTHIPPGSALLTDTLDGTGNGSSVLNSKGITHIIHAAPMPRSHFVKYGDEGFINCVVKSVQNSIILADRYKFEKLAIPLVGGGIYLGSCDPQKLAEGIARGVINQLEKCQNLKRISLIDWDGSSDNYLLKAFESEFMDKDELFASAVSRDNHAFGKSKSNPEKLLGCNNGDIRDINIHGANVIVNAANTQVKFGGGISGAIAEQVGNKTKIEAKAQELISKFNQ